MKIAIGNDQAGFLLKQEVMAYLAEKKIPYEDFGSYDEQATDYPIHARAVAQAVLSGEYDTGILICGTGIGISIAANRIKGIRAALCGDCFSAEASRQHNDANILCMGGRVTGKGLAVKIVDTFLNTPYSGEARHQRRIEMLED